MKVWLVMQDYPYSITDRNDIVSVHKTKDGAKRSGR